MGSGFRTFQSGEVLTAANVQNYLMDQSVQVFAGTAALGSAIGTAVEAGMVAYLTDSEQVIHYAPYASEGTAWNSLPMRGAAVNLVINGGMDIWQRGTSFPAISNTAYSCDRWWVVTDAVGTVNATRQEISGQGLGFTYCLRAERTSSTNRWVVGTNLETTALNRIKGKSTVLSFFARKGSGLTSDLSVSFATKSTEAKFGSNVNSTTLTVSNASLSTSTFSRYSVALSVPANTAALGLAVEFSATQAGAANAFFEITGVQIEEGVVPTPFEFEDIGTTLAKCQRYYQKSYNLDTNPGTSTTVGANRTKTAFTNSFHHLPTVKFAPRMRATPTVTVYSTTGASGNMRNISSSVDVASASFMTGENSVVVYVGNVSIAADNDLAHHYVAEIEL